MWADDDQREPFRELHHPSHSTIADPDGAFPFAAKLHRMLRTQLFMSDSSSARRQTDGRARSSRWLFYPRPLIGLAIMAEPPRAQVVRVELAGHAFGSFASKPFRIGSSKGAEASARVDAHNAELLRRCSEEAVDLSAAARQRIWMQKSDDEDGVWSTYTADQGIWRTLRPVPGAAPEHQFVKVRTWRAAAPCFQRRTARSLARYQMLLADAAAAGEAIPEALCPVQLLFGDGCTAVRMPFLRGRPARRSDFEGNPAAVAALADALAWLALQDLLYTDLRLANIMVLEDCGGGSGSGSDAEGDTGGAEPGLREEEDKSHAALPAAAAVRPACTAGAGTHAGVSACSSEGHWDTLWAAMAAAARALHSSSPTSNAAAAAPVHGADRERHGSDRAGPQPAPASAASAPPAGPFGSRGLRSEHTRMDDDAVRAAPPAPPPSKPLRLNLKVKLIDYDDMRVVPGLSRALRAGGGLRAIADAFAAYRRVGCRSFACDPERGRGGCGGDEWDFAAGVPEEVVPGLRRELQQQLDQAVLAWRAWQAKEAASAGGL